MKFNFNLPIMHLTGDSIKDQEGEVTYRRAIWTSLLSEVPGTMATGDDKAKRFELALKVQSADDNTEFSVDEAKRIKDHIGAVSGALIVGRVHHFIEGK